jgi:hypothetical protein
MGLQDQRGVRRQAVARLENVKATCRVCNVYLVDVSTGRTIGKLSRICLVRQKLILVAQLMKLKVFV